MTPYIYIFRRREISRLSSSTSKIIYIIIFVFFLIYQIKISLYQKKKIIIFTIKILVDLKKMDLLLLVHLMGYKPMKAQIAGPITGPSPSLANIVHFGPLRIVVSFAILKCVY